MNLSFGSLSAMKTNMNFLTEMGIFKYFRIICLMVYLVF